MLFWHFTRYAACRTCCTAGSNSPISTAMIPRTTSTSMRVKAGRGGSCRAIGGTSLGVAGPWGRRSVRRRGAFGRAPLLRAVWHLLTPQHRPISDTDSRKRTHSKEDCTQRQPSHADYVLILFLP